MRITGGRYRSRSLKAPKGSATRPTSDRVREALFSILTSAGVFASADGPRVLDLFAGTGALAFEALSRGAREAVLVEGSRPAAAIIRENARALDVVDRIRVIEGGVEPALAALRDGFDLVFVDPPYADVRTARFGRVLGLALGVLEPGGWLVLEHASADPPPVPVCPSDAGDARVSCTDTRTYGDTALTLFQRDPP